MADFEPFDFMRGKNGAITGKVSHGGSLQHSFSIKRFKLSTRLFTVVLDVVYSWVWFYLSLYFGVVGVG